MNLKCCYPVVLGFIVSVAVGCQTDRNSDIPEDIKRVFQKAGANAEQLEKVIFHYKHEDVDSLKLQSAYFLIRYMPGKGYREYCLEDSSGRDVILNLFVLKNKDSILAAIRAYERIHKTLLKFNYKGFKEDIKEITADVLIENIDLAHKAWRLPWATHLSHAEFCELILPYRVSNEPLQRWRKSFWINYSWIKAAIASQPDPIKAACLINNSLKGRYTYRHSELDFYPGFLDLKQLEDFAGGRCEDLNVEAAYAMRAVGLPISLEFTPFWSNSNYSGHSWLSVVDSNGKHIPFNSAYDNPIEDSLPFQSARLAKIYRYSYAEQQHCLLNLYPNDTVIPGLFRDKHFFDISQEYIKVSDLKIPLIPKKKAPKLAYLAVLNGSQWKPIHWGVVKNDSAIFRGIGREAIYAPLYYDNNGFVETFNYSIAGDAFYLTGDGNVQYLVPDVNDTSTMYFDFSQLTWLVPKQYYSVYYWDRFDWKTDGQKHFLNESPRSYKVLEKWMSITGQPNNTMYRVVSDSITAETELGRPFIYNTLQKRYRDY